MEYTTAEKFLNDVIAQRNNAMLIGIHEPNLAIYMNEKAWASCCHELYITGEKSLSHELSTNRIYGYNVYRIRQPSHADYKIYLCEVEL